MVNGSDIIEFEERNSDDLIKLFIEEHKTEYDDFVLNEYNTQKANQADITEAQAEDLMLEEAREKDFEEKNG